MTTSQILLVDDDVLTGKLIGFVLADAGYGIQTLADPRGVVEMLGAHPVDLILLDITLPHLDGYAVARQVRREYPEIPLIFLSARGQVSDMAAGFAQGADDYIAKPFEPTELLARIGAVLRRYRRADRHLFGAVIRVGEVQLDLGELVFTGPDRRPATLTPTEMKLLECLMRNANAVISRETLIQRTWGYDDAGFGNRVDVYIRRIRNKIEDDPSDPHYIHTVRGLGYVFRERKHAA